MHNLYMRNQCVIYVYCLKVFDTAKEEDQMKRLKAPLAEGSLECWKEVLSGFGYQGLVWAQPTETLSQSLDRSWCLSQNFYSDIHEELAVFA